MKVELFPFQKIALQNLRGNLAEALESYHRTNTPQVVSFTAPTGAGKTIIIAALIESIYFGDGQYPDQPNAIFVWLSDSPELNEQSKLKIDLKADKIRLAQCVTISDESFDREILEDGHIYLLNTQKLGKSSNLTKKSDVRQYTIWETLRNTVREKSDRLYFIIDEAHRGMQGREAGKATTIMQKFIKGSPDDVLSPMPVVLGMSATNERFNTLVEGTTSTIHKVMVTPEEVRSSGLLKDRIIISYPENSSIHNDMAVLQAAADEWKNKWEHWNQYCQEQHYAYVNPIFIVQVQNGTDSKISETDLSDCLQKIEERLNYRFETGEVIHTFGQTSSTLSIHGIEVPYEEPSRIADNKKIKIVFFKENLSTGWDCPRAETMMSFRHANDATYIAQLLGRMIRTPMQMHIQVDDTLNDVHLFLPYFDTSTVENIVDALQSTEGGEIPTDISGEIIGEKKFDTLTVKPSCRIEQKQKKAVNPNSPIGNTRMGDYTETNNAKPVVNTDPPTDLNIKSSYMNYRKPDRDDNIQFGAQDNQSTKNVFDPETVMKAINDAGLLTYDVRSVRINNYLTSLNKMARLLSQTGLYIDATTKVKEDIVKLIHDYIGELKSSGQYDDLVLQAKQFKLSTQIFDVFGESVNNHEESDLFPTTDTDIDRQFRLAETRLGGDGVGQAYGRIYGDVSDPIGFKVDVILFVADNDCIAKLNSYAEKHFHELNDGYRRQMVKVTEHFRKQYDSIVSDGDITSKHNFHIPETINTERILGGKKYYDHLFVNESGYVTIKLNTWEDGVLDEERRRSDYVCWLRNPSRKSWSLCIPYELNGEKKSAYPDFLIIRHNDQDGYVIDILEPHDPTRKDNLGKAKGFAEYARQNPCVGRIELIRIAKDPAGKNRFKRLDMSRNAIRDKVFHAASNEELDRIFETDGEFSK